MKREKELVNSFYRNNHISYICGIIFTILRGLAYIFMSYLAGAMVDEMTKPNGGSMMRFILPITLGILSIALIGTLMFVSRSIFIHKGMAQFKDHVFEKVTQKSFRAFSKENTGRYLSVLSNDMSKIEENYLNGSFALLYCAITFTASLFMVFKIDWHLALFLIISGLLPLVVTAFMSNKIASVEKSVSDENESFMAQLKDLLAGFSVIKSYKVEKQGITLFSKVNHEVEQKKRKYRTMVGSLDAVGDGLSFIMQSGTFIYGGYLVLNGTITAGSVLAVVSLSNYIFQPLSAAPQYWAGYCSAKKLISKICNIIGENEDEKTGVMIKDGRDIDLCNLAFAYDDGNDVLKGISCHFEKGKKYALIGSSGSGKSTLLNLLMGAFGTYQGSATIDHTEIKEINSDSLFDKVDLIDQNVFLFDASIEDNITMFKQVDKNTLQEAIHKAGLDELVAKKGLDFKCGENGHNLSGGEKQRISIARSLVKGTPILLLDEITSALDKKTAHEVNKAIIGLDNVMCIEITHRLDKDTLSDFDELLVMKDGMIKETGTFDELYNNKDYFYSLYTVAGD